MHIAVVHIAVPIPLVKKNYIYKKGSGIGTPFSSSSFRPHHTPTSFRAFGRNVLTSSRVRFSLKKNSVPLVRIARAFLSHHIYITDALFLIRIVTVDYRHGVFDLTDVDRTAHMCPKATKSGDSFPRQDLHVGKLKTRELHKQNWLWENAHLSSFEERTLLVHGNHTLGSHFGTDRFRWLRVKTNL